VKKKKKSPTETSDLNTPKKSRLESSEEKDAKAETMSEAK
jgi:hypothetical protein